ncbi:MAG: SDR family oxidoreductase [Crocinitomicaceae bacterium]|nr:SDR family oxidoreductase [Crocinitomicaceae bacterium]
MQNSQKNIIITGASKGIGFALTKHLSKHHRVLSIARNTKSLISLANENANVTALNLDITDENLVSKLEKEIKSHFNSVDILINNAGFLVNKPFTQITRKEMMAVYSTNVFGLMELCQAVIPFMSKGAHIVNIGSMGGFQGSTKFSGLSVYSSSKAAVAGFTECLAEELKQDQISVNCLALGAVQTEMLSAAFPEFKAPVTATEMAAFIANFALTGNQYFNGKVLPVSSTTP